jgi:hypothetical protein
MEDQEKKKYTNGAKTGLKVKIFPSSKGGTRDDLALLVRLTDLSSVCA